MRPLLTYQPPYELTADFLFVTALARTVPLQKSFPGIPFLSILGKTPLILWFSRITEACYYDINRQRQCEHNTDEIPYTELNVITMLNKRCLFVPNIYASSHLTVQIASLYGMPKTLHALSWNENKAYISSSLIEPGYQSTVQARVFKTGKIGAKLLSAFLPLTSWPALFPAKRSVQAIIQNIPAVRLAWIKQGQLAIPEPWLPKPVSFFPLGLYLPRLSMTLPPP
jgi:hypothetical protein